MLLKAEEKPSVCERRRQAQVLAPGAGNVTSEVGRGSPRVSDGPQFTRRGQGWSRYCSSGLSSQHYIHQAVWTRGWAIWSHQDGLRGKNEPLHTVNISAVKTETI